LCTRREFVWVIDNNLFIGKIDSHASLASTARYTQVATKTISNTPSPLDRLRLQVVARRVRAAEAFLLQLTKRGLEGDGAAARATLAVIEEVTERPSTHQGLPSVIVRTLVAPGSVTSALEPLRMAKKLDPYRETARIALEPWLVEAALARLPQPLSPADQRIVVKATRTPRKVRWPEWWTENP
jgi:hypothetical protein